jgi:hypothetical protein
MRLCFATRRAGTPICRRPSIRLPPQSCARNDTPYGGDTFWTNPVAAYNVVADGARVCRQLCTCLRPREG